MSELSDLYQEVILDHNRRPRNFHALDNATHTADGHNPLCGDRLRVYLKVEDGIVSDVAFEGAGCAISTASASLMSEAVKGKAKADIHALFEKFHAMVTGKGPSDGLDKLEVFSGVSEFPVRVKCASLAWHTLKAALEGQRDTVSTE